MRPVRKDRPYWPAATHAKFAASLLLPVPFQRAT
jgi:hypothetical protein